MITVTPKIFAAACALYGEYIVTRCRSGEVVELVAVKAEEKG